MATDRKRKPLNIKVDTKNVDATLVTDGEGNLKATLDTPKVDVEVTKDSKGLHINVDIDESKEYEFESNGNADTLPKGIWKVTGEFVKIFLKQGLGKLKK
jgi:hypothetical protein